MASGTANSSSRQPVGFHDAAPRVNSDQVIEQHLARTKRRIKLHDLGVASMTLVGVVTLYLFALVLIDHWVFELTKWSRFAALGLLVLGAGYYGARTILPLLLSRINPGFAARAIEQSEPSLKNSLINFLMCRREPTPTGRLVHRALQQRAALDLQRVNVDLAVDQTPLIRIGYVVAILMVLFAGYTILSPKNVFQTLKRVSIHWADIARPSRVDISNVLPGDSEVVLGNRVEVSADIAGATPDDIMRLLYTTEDNQIVDRAITMQPPSQGLTYRCTLPATPEGIRQDVRYRIEAGDARSPEFQLTMIRVPSIVVDKIEYEYPAYTEMEPRVTVGEGEIRALEGTWVTVHAQANHPIDKARLEFDPTGQKSSDGWDMDVEGDRSSLKFQVKWDDDRNAPEHSSYRIVFVPQLDLKELDSTEFPLPAVHKILVTPDLPPEISILTPRGKSIELPVNGTQPIEIRAIDPDFGLKQITLQMRARGRQEFTKNFLSGQAPQTGQVMREFSLRPRQQQFQPGDRVTIWAEATDNCGLSPHAARTPDYVVTILPADSAVENGAADSNDDSESEQTSQAGEQPQEGMSEEEGQGSDDSQGANSSDSGSDSDEGDSSQQQEGGENDSGESNEGGENSEQSQGESGAEAADSGSEQEEGDEGESAGGESQQADQGEESEGNQSGEGGQQQSGTEAGNSDDQQGENEQGANGAGGDSGGSDSEQGSTNGSPTGQSDSSSANTGASDSENSSVGNSQPGEDTSAQGKMSEQNSGSSGEPSESLHDGDAFERMLEYLKNNGDTQPQEKPSSSDSNQDQQGSPDAVGQSSPAESAGNDRQESQHQSAGAAPPDNASPSQAGNPADQRNSEGAPSEAASDTGGKEPSASAEKKDPGGKGEAGQEAEPSAADEGNEAPDSNNANASQQTPGMGEDNSAGDGRSSDSQDGSVDRQKPSRDQTQEPGNTNEASSDQAAQSPSQSQHNSDSQGDDEGDRSGGGEKGGGQSANQPGRDSPGSNTSSDEGNSGSPESGTGESADRAGDQQQASDSTGESGQQQGAGSESRSAADGQQPSTDGTPSMSPQDGSDADTSNTETPDRPDPSNSDPASTSSGRPPEGGGIPSNAATTASPTDQEVAEADAANLEYARQTTDLVLQRLRDMQHDPDPELLESLDYTKEELQAFVNRWEMLKRNAQESGAASSELEDALRSLGLRRTGPGLRTSNTDNDQFQNLRDSGQRRRPPAEILEQFDAYRKGAARGERRGG